MAAASPQSTPPAPGAVPLVDFEGVSVFQDARAVLTDVTFRLAPGEFAYLIGRTGTGKSTLLKTIYAALPLKQGRGAVNGFQLDRLTRRTIPALRRTLGIVFQDFNLLYDRDVHANLAFVLEATGWTDRRAVAERVGEVLTQVDMAAMSRERPHRLSGGEQQRLVLARALLNRPPLLVADEPTGNLDPETADDVMHLIRRLAAEYGMGVLFATHDYRVIERFPARILRCQRGRVLGEGGMGVL